MKRVAPLVAAVVACLAAASLAAPGPQVERGRYLATVAACVGCHTARTPHAAPLAGGVMFGSGPDAPVSANITPDDATGIGRWSEVDIATALHTGRRPDGSRIGPPMPQVAYAGLSDADAAAIAAFLKSVAPARHSVAAVHREPQPAPASRRPSPEALSRGRYLFAAVAHCAECHAGPSAPAAERAAPRTFAGPNGPVVAPPLTSGRLATLSDEALATIITRGTRPDGSRIVGPMPVAAYAHLTAEDLAAIVGYLRSP